MMCMVLHVFCLKPDLLMTGCGVTAGSPPPVEESPEEGQSPPASPRRPPTRSSPPPLEADSTSSLQSQLASRHFGLDSSEQARQPVGDYREHRVKSGRNVLMKPALQKGDGQQQG